MTDKQEDFKMIPIPSSIADVTPPLCRRVFVEVLGGLIYHEKGELKGSRFVFCLGDVWSTMDHHFNPFENIQDTKLLEKAFLDKHQDCDMRVTVSPWRCFAGIYREDGGAYDVPGKCDVRHKKWDMEPFARACAVLMAYNKLKEDK